MKCKICEKMATRSSRYGIFCEKHWREQGMDGTSVEEEVKNKYRELWTDNHS